MLFQFSCSITNYFVLYLRIHVTLHDVFDTIYTDKISGCSYRKNVKCMDNFCRTAHGQTDSSSIMLLLNFVIESLRSLLHIIREEGFIQKRSQGSLLFGGRRTYHTCHIARVGHPFFSKERSVLCVLLRSL